MKAVVIGERADVTMDQIMEVYPRHKLVLDRYIDEGSVIGVGPLLSGGNLGIFKNREAAERFVQEDPFLLEGMVKSYTIHDWADKMIAV